MTSRATGRQRGRPPYPLLTPAEERVLEFVRQGKTNAEIGVRLGVSPDAVKYHVSNLLGKAGLSTREELAGWQPQPGTFFGRAWGGIPLLGKVALGASAIVVAGGMAWGLAFRGESAPPLRDGPVTLGYDGKPANDTSSNPKLSADGRYVVFESRASNLVPNDTNNASDIFRYDRKTGVMEMVNRDSAFGAQAHFPATNPSVSADGNLVSYTQWQANGAQAVLRDLAHGTTRVISSDRGGGFTSVSPDGRFFAYGETDPLFSQLPTGRIVVGDLRSGAVLYRVELDRSKDLNQLAMDFSFSPNGRWFVFNAGLVPGTGCDPIERGVIFNGQLAPGFLQRPVVHDMDTGNTTCPPLDPLRANAVVWATSPVTASNDAVVFGESVTEAGGGALVDTRLVLLNPLTGQVKSFGRGQDPVFTSSNPPAVSRDRAAFIDTLHSRRVIVLNLASGSEVQIGTQPPRFAPNDRVHEQPALSADGHHLAYVVSGVDTTSGSHVGDIYVTTLK
jgi:DNA-binding CsgD family transcriptional regulator/Tol biopolymer transport system component